MSPVTRETPPRAQPAAATGPTGKPGPITIRRLPPPPQATGKGTPAPAIDPAQTILGYTAPLAPGPVAPAPEDVLPAGSRVGDYEIVELIGVGGMGSVYRARYPVIDREVAIKVIASQLCRDPGVVQQFVIEARAANQIANRHVVDIHTLGTLPDGRPYLVMELLRGQTLTQRIGYGALDVDDAVPILEQIAEAMEAAHAVPIVHRDLKPDNVFLEDSADGPQVKILDFGIARLAGEASPVEANDDDRSEILVGTPFYMAPEQARALLVGTPADLYALGLIAFEMLAGRAPFAAETASEVLAAHQHSIPPSLKSLRPEVPEGLDELVERLLAKDPGERPTATEVRAQLRALYQRRSYPRSVPAVGLPLGERARLWAQRFRAPIAIGAAAVAVAVLAVLVLGGGGDGDTARARAPAAPSVAAPSAAIPSGAPGASPAPGVAPSAAASSVAPRVEPSVAPVAPSAAAPVAPAGSPSGAAAVAPTSPAAVAPSVEPLEPAEVAPPAAAPVKPAAERSPASPDRTESPAAAPSPPSTRDRDAPIADPFAP